MEIQTALSGIETATLEPSSLLSSALIISCGDPGQRTSGWRVEREALPRVVVQCCPGISVST